MQPQKYFYAVMGLFVALTLANIASTHANTIDTAAYDVRLDRAASAESVHLTGRVNNLKDGEPALLRGGGSLFVKEATEAGTYYIKFQLQEPDKFQYHRAYIGLFVSDPKDLKSDGYYLFWDPAGVITLNKTVNGQSTRLNQFIRGGKDNPNRFKAGDVIELTLQVPEKGDGVWLWCRSANTEGEPTTGFKLSDDLPKKGYFGAYNAKWYSHMAVYELRYQPLMTSE